MTTLRRPPLNLVRHIAAEEAAAARVKTDEVLGKRRHAPIVWARKRLWRRLRGLGYSYPGIGQVVGAHHTSVRYACLDQVPDRPPPSREYEEIIRPRHAA